MLLFVCLALVAGSLAQVPTTCPGPKQFEGRFQRYDRERQAMVRGYMGYDETQRRVREFEDVSVNKTHVSYDVLRLYDQNIEYRLDLSTRNCTVGQPRHRWHPIGVPPDGKYVGEGVVGPAGVPGESVTVASFEGTLEGDNFFITVTYPDCFPVERACYSKDFAELTTYHDLQSGVSDPELFLPPKECKVPI